MGMVAKVALMVAKAFPVASYHNIKTDIDKWLPRCRGQLLGCHDVASEK